MNGIPLARRVAAVAGMVIVSAGVFAGVSYADSDHDGGSGRPGTGHARCKYGFFGLTKNQCQSNDGARARRYRGSDGRDGADAYGSRGGEATGTDGTDGESGNHNGRPGRNGYGYSGRGHTYDSAYDTSGTYNTSAY